MINIITFPNDTKFLIPVGYLSLGTLISEVLCYPFECLSARQIQKSNSKFHLFSAFKEIFTHDKLAIFRGLRISIEKGLTRNFINYVIFNVLHNNFAFRHYHQKEQNIVPKSSNAFKYIDMHYFKTYLCLLISLGFSNYITQQHIILRLKTQCDPLCLEKRFQKPTQHAQEIMMYQQNPSKVLQRLGFFNRLTYNSLLFYCEIILFQYLLLKDQQEFQNIHGIEQKKIRQISNSELLKYTSISSSVASFLCYPFNVIWKKKLMRQLQNKSKLEFINHIQQIYQDDGVTGFFKGVTTNIIKNTIRNTILVSILMQKSNEIVNEREYLQ